MDFGLSINLNNEYKEDYFIEMAENGFSCVEISCAYQGWENGLVNRLKGLAERLCNILVKNRLSPTSFHIPYGFDWSVADNSSSDEMNAAERISSLCESVFEYGFGTYVLHASFEPVVDKERPQMLSQAKSGTALLSEFFTKNSKRLAIENLPRTCIGKSSAECMSVIGESSAGICLDVNHIIGESTDDFFETCGKRICACHLSDYDGVDEKHWLPGDGIIDWKSVFSGFARIGYNKPYIFELGTVEPKVVAGRLEALGIL